MQGTRMQKDRTSKGQVTMATALRLLLSGTVVVFSLLSFSSAQQQQNANLYAFFNWTGGPFGQNLDQELIIRQKAASSYWAMIWQMVNTTNAGYLGLQTNGHRFDGSAGDTAIFSIWGANRVQGPACGAFGGEGNGLSCRIAYPIALNHWYRLRVWKISANSSGVWWGAWVEDETTNIDTPVGQILVPAGQTFLTSQANFSEYFGPPVASPNLVPRSVVVWSSPSADETAPGHHRYTSTFSRGTQGAGTTGSVTGGVPVNTPLLHNPLGVRIVQGG